MNKNLARKIIYSILAILIYLTFCLVYQVNTYGQRPADLMIWIIIVALLFVFSLVWSGPLLLCRFQAVIRERSALFWVSLAILVSPFGWVSAISLIHVRLWMIPFSIAAPLLCALLLKILPMGSKAHALTRSWWLIVLTLAYGLWSAKNVVAYYGIVSIAGSHRNASLGNLASIRSALTIYFSDNDKVYPSELEGLVPRYLEKIPEVHGISEGMIVHHLPTSLVTNVKNRQSDDRGGWGYVNQPKLPDGQTNPDFGSVFINCTHKDVRNSKQLSDE